MNKSYFLITMNKEEINVLNTFDFSSLNELDPSLGTTIILNNLSYIQSFY